MVKRKLSEEHKKKISEANKGRKRPDLVKINNARIKEIITLICKCGKLFKVKPSKINAKYCSQECYHKFTNHNHTQGKHWKLSKDTKIKQGLHQIGEKNHQWNGGYFRGKYIGISDSKEFARNVFKRDKFFCQICGDTGRKAKLNAHHLNSVDKFPKQVKDLKNGITLCQKHHREFHNLYGYGNNTKKQFEEFIHEKIIEIEVIQLSKANIYNLTLEGEDTFFANGIFTHNTPPHLIKPKNKKSLKFKGKNGAVFSKGVKHPGSRPNPFIRNAIQLKLRNIIEEELQKVSY